MNPLARFSRRQITAIHFTRDAHSQNYVEIKIDTLTDTETVRKKLIRNTIIKLNHAVNCVNLVLRSSFILIKYFVISNCYENIKTFVIY